MTFSELKPNIFQLENTFSFKLSEELSIKTSPRHHLNINLLLIWHMDIFWVKRLDHFRFKFNLLLLRLEPPISAFLIFLFYKNTVNHKQILTNYYNYQEYTDYYLGGYKNTMLEQKLVKQITKIKILKEKRKVKQ